jgi:hypothetical protein
MNVQAEGGTQRTELLSVRLPVRTKDKDTFRLIFGEQSGPKVTQKICRGAFQTSMLNDCAPLGARSTVTFSIFRDGEERRTVSKEKGWNVGRGAGKGSKAVSPGRASEWEIRWHGVESSIGCEGVL